MLRHHLSIVMLRIFADIAHVWQLDYLHLKICTKRVKFCLKV